jgi:type II secretory pathway component PulM
MRRRIYEEARRVLLGQGAAIVVAVNWTVIHDQPLVRQPDESYRGLGALRLGLTALARHFGLTPRQTVILGNAASDTASSPA